MIYQKEDSKIDINVNMLDKNKLNLNVKLRRIKMIQFIIGIFLGATISLFLYALILCGANADKKINKEENSG